MSELESLRREAALRADRSLSLELVLLSLSEDHIVATNHAVGRNRQLPVDPNDEYGTALLTYVMLKMQARRTHRVKLTYPQDAWERVRQARSICHAMVQEVLG